MHLALGFQLGFAPSLGLSPGPPLGLSPAPPLGLSLGTSMILAEDGSVAFRGQDELSICEEGKRPGTWIDTMDGRPCRAVECFSKSADGARANAHPNR